MPTRVQLKADVYMHLDGQPQIVLSGSIIDIPDTVNLHPTHFSVSGVANSVVKSTSVSGVHTK